MADYEQEHEDLITDKMNVAAPPRPSADTQFEALCL